MIVIPLFPWANNIYLLLLKMTNKRSSLQNEMKEIQVYKDDIENHIKQRTFRNQKDYQFFKKIDQE